jgi:hypothetical protein
VLTRAASRPSNPPQQQVVSEDPTDEWAITKPRELRTGAFGASIYKDLPPGAHIKEKNWMPFVHDGELHMTYSLVPHRVFK